MLVPQEREGLVVPHGPVKEREQDHVADHRVGHKDCPNKELCTCKNSGHASHSCSMDLGHRNSDSLAAVHRDSRTGTLATVLEWWESAASEGPVQVGATQSGVAAHNGDGKTCPGLPFVPPICACYLVSS